MDGQRLADGIYTIIVTAVDAWDNSSDPAIVLVTVDNPVDLADAWDE